MSIIGLASRINALKFRRLSGRTRFCSGGGGYGELLRPAAGSCLTLPRKEDLIQDNSRSRQMFFCNLHSGRPVDLPLFAGKPFSAKDVEAPWLPKAIISCSSHRDNMILGANYKARSAICRPGRSTAWAAFDEWHAMRTITGLSRLETKANYSQIATTNPNELYVILKIIYMVLDSVYGVDIRHVVMILWNMIGALSILDQFLGSGQLKLDRKDISLIKEKVDKLPAQTAKEIVVQLDSLKLKEVVKIGCLADVMKDLEKNEVELAKLRAELAKVHADLIQHLHEAQTFGKVSTAAEPSGAKGSQSNKADSDEASTVGDLSHPKVSTAADPTGERDDGPTNELTFLFRGGPSDDGLKV